MSTALEVQYKYVCEEQRKAALRNASLVQDVARLRHKLSLDKTTQNTKLDALKHQYEAYVMSAYHSWQHRVTAAQRTIPQPVHMYELLSDTSRTNTGISRVDTQRQPDSLLSSSSVSHSSPPPVLGYRQQVTVPQEAKPISTRQTVSLKSPSEVVQPCGSDNKLLLKSSIPVPVRKPQKLQDSAKQDVVRHHFISSPQSPVLSDNELNSSQESEEGRHDPVLHNTLSDVSCSSRDDPEIVEAKSVDREQLKKEPGYSLEQELQQKECEILLSQGEDDHSQDRPVSSNPHHLLDELSLSSASLSTEHAQPGTMQHTEYAIQNAEHAQISSIQHIEHGQTGTLHQTEHGTEPIHSTQSVTQQHTEHAQIETVQSAPQDVGFGQEDDNHVMSRESSPPSPSTPLANDQELDSLSDFPSSNVPHSNTPGEEQVRSPSLETPISESPSSPAIGGTDSQPIKQSRGDEILGNPTTILALVSTLNDHLSSEPESVDFIYTIPSASDNMKHNISHSDVVSSRLNSFALKGEDLSSWDSGVVGVVLLQQLSAMSQLQGSLFPDHLLLEDAPLLDTHNGISCHINRLWSTIWPALLEHMELLLKSGKQLNELVSVFVPSLVTMGNHSMREKATAQLLHLLSDNMVSHPSTGQDDDTPLHQTPAYRSLARSDLEDDVSLPSSLISESSAVAQIERELQELVGGASTGMGGAYTDMGMGSVSVLRQGSAPLPQATGDGDMSSGSETSLGYIPTTIEHKSTNAPVMSRSSNNSSIMKRRLGFTDSDSSEDSGKDELVRAHSLKESTIDEEFEFSTTPL